MKKQNKINHPITTQEELFKKLFPRRPQSKMRYLTGLISVVALIELALFVLIS
jgi:hypothetical protein